MLKELWDDTLLLIGLARDPEPKHHLEDKKRKGWYRICTTRKVCEAGTRTVTAELTLFLETESLEFGGWDLEPRKIREKSLEFKKVESIEATIERMKKMIPVLEEVAARMKAESL